MAHLIDERTAETLAQSLGALARDKAVAVVGGGNSAFSAARDLLPFAREIHVVNVIAHPAAIDHPPASSIHRREVR